jgi:PleD family two-component response regulator
MRVLLVESDQEDVVFLRDVLAEIGEGRYFNNWVNMEILETGSWGEAASLLSNQAVDIVLLDPDLRDSQGMETFRRAQHDASEIPMVLLMGASEELLGVQLIRAGAQDFLVKKQVDCAPLAHAMRNAIERHRLLAASRAASTLDSLTGLLNRAGFLAWADRDRKLAERLGRRLMLILAEIPSGYDEQGRDLALIEAADRFRGVAGPADVLARLDPTRFGMTVIETDSESLEAAWARIHAALRPHRIRIGTAIFGRDRPVTLEALMEQASMDLRPSALAQGAL